MVSGTLIEGEQATLENLPREERSGEVEIINLFGGANRVFLLLNPVVYQGGEPIHVSYLVLRSNQVQAGGREQKSY